MTLQRALLIGVALAGLAGCANQNFGLPQSREEFVKVYKDGGMFRNAEHYTINRPKAAVVADLNQFATKCLNVRVTTTIRQGYATDRSTATYHPRMVEAKGGITSLTVQETYRDKPEKGHPPGGLYSLVADMSARGGQTQLDIYHAGRTAIAKSVKSWAEGDKASCPNF